ncbi:MAG: caspase domain-containing protein [Xanthobacteraceae bacterium]
MPTKFSVLIAVVAALFVLPLSAGAALAQKRVALVIGNSTYQSVARLANPINDAAAIAQMFKNAGFDSVTMRRDLGVLEFKRALREFLDAAQDAEIAVMYYAGHGIQVGDMNYMIPVDARLATENDVQDETVSLDRIMMSLQPAKRLRLVLLDSCRENPFLNRMKVSKATRSLGRGLARVEPENNTLVAYAAKGGQIAQDGAGENSPFTSALLKHLAVPGLDVRLALGRVRDEVLKSTANKQEPFVYGSLGGESISLVPAPVQAASEPLSDIKGDYELVERIGTRKAWEAFLASHKEGLYAELARAQLAKLTQGGGKATVVDTGNSHAGLAPIELTPPPKPNLPSRDRIDWDLIWETGDRAKLRDFIAKYPSSPLAETAKSRLEALDRAAQERDEKARAEQEAARRAEEARRLEGEAARKRAEEQARVPRPADEARNRPDENCGRDEQKLNLLRPYATQGWAREDLKRLERNTACDRIRAEVTTLLGGPGADLGQRSVPPQQMGHVAPQQPSKPQQQPANALDPVLSAIAELRRLGCFAEYKDPTLADAIAQAIRQYLAEKGRPAEDVKAVEKLLVELKVENERLCALACSQGQRPDRCKADAKSDSKSGKRESHVDAKQASPPKTTRSLMAAHSEGATPAPPKGVGVGF